MELKDGIAAGALAVSFIALAVAIVALRRTSAHNAAMRHYASAGPDIALAGQMNQARQMITNVALKMAEIRKGKTDDELTDKEWKQLTALDPLYAEAVEALHKSYNLACRLYLDGSVDRDRVRGQYERDVLRGRDSGRPRVAVGHFDAL